MRDFPVRVEDAQAVCVFVRPPNGVRGKRMERRSRFVRSSGEQKERGLFRYSGKFSVGMFGTVASGRAFVNTNGDTKTSRSRLQNYFHMRGDGELYYVQSRTFSTSAVGGRAYLEKGACW